MWKRKELKDRAKASFRKNYWKTFLVALVLTVIVGGSSSAASASGSTIGLRKVFSFDSNSRTTEYGEVYSYEDMFDEDGNFVYDETVGGMFGEDGSFVYDESYNEFDDVIERVTGSDIEQYVPLILAGSLIVVFFAMIAAAIAILISVFILNPLEVGARRFFYRNLNQPAEIKEVAFAFDHSFKNVVNIMFFKGLFQFLWSLLFIIPGIIKGYEYSMIPYLIAEYPDMPKEDAFAISKYMMKGNKWRAFVLDLSFIPWHLLSLVTLGIVGTFYVAPYIDQTKAALYDAIKEQKRPFDSVATEPAEVIPQVGE